MPIACQYCLQPAALVLGAVLHPRHPLLARKPYWHCAACKAWVGCHPGTNQPLGTLATKPLRIWRENAHNLFDPLWSRPMVHRGHAGVPVMGRGMVTRHQAYAWLAEAMNLTGDECHISMMTEEQCKEVVHLCRIKRGLV